MAEGHTESALARATALLARREHSELELARKLRLKGFTAQAIAEALRTLVKQGLLSDQRFTEALVNSRRECGYGPLRVRRDLQARGVAEELIDQWVDESDPEWLPALKRLWQKKFAGQAPADYREWARQARFLQSRGFSTEQIRSVIGFND